MYKVYQYQMVLLHASYITVGGWAYFTWLKEVSWFNYNAKTFGIEKKYSVWPVYIPDQILYLISLAFVIRAIRDELRWMMNIILLFNILEIGCIVYRLIVWCPDDIYNSNEFVRYVEIPPEYDYSDDIPRRRKSVIGRV
ncbi:12857_t:CDS:2 [Funneliformis geosporum]|uniref:4935_t:CDS:1 n=1 Tax=Funneliformis geosporum TaxID=1117311 RepID=A0A9W4SIS1_9GLOM|nr:4935_t:CDS:2 [Funneliformis geosporum]CAI2178192.1 12857_t:CDS:2 [Funneliformis geosporum]